MVAEVQLSDADKRQIVYSSLLKFSPETTSLRDRALDRLILGALVGSTEDNAFQVAHILGNIQVSRNGPRLREEVVREGLDRLMEAGKVSKTEKKKRRHFYLSELGKAETSEAVTSADQLFEQALREMLKNTEHHFTFAVGGNFNFSGGRMAVECVEN